MVVKLKHKDEVSAKIEEWNYIFQFSKKKIITSILNTILPLIGSFDRKLSNSFAWRKKQRTTYQIIYLSVWASSPWSLLLYFWHKLFFSLHQTGDQLQRHQRVYKSKLISIGICGLRFAFTYVRYKHLNNLILKIICKFLKP